MAGFNSITGNVYGSVMSADNVSFDGTERGGIITANGELLIGSAVAPHIRKGTLTSTGGSVSITNGQGTINLEAGAVVPTTFTENSGTATPALNNLNVFGQQAGTVPVMFTIGSGSTVNVEDRTWTTPFVVDGSSTVGLRGTYSTIQSAIDAASSGQTVFIRAGTYIENITLKAGVNLSSYTFENVTIVGNVSASYTGRVSLNRLTLQTNSNFCISVTGSNATLLIINNSRILGSNNTAIEYTSSSSSSAIQINYSVATISNTYALYSMTSPGNLGFLASSFGGTTTASNNSAGNVNFIQNNITLPLSTSGTGVINIYNNTVNLLSSNTTCITTSGTGSVVSFKTNYLSGTASAISVGSGTTFNSDSDSVFSSNTNAITGLGTIVFSPISMGSTSSLINTTTQTSRSLTFPRGASAGTITSNSLFSYEEGTWTPVVNFGGGSTGITYTTQNGRYTRIGRQVFANAHIVLSSKGTSTGSANVTGLPYATIALFQQTSTVFSAGSLTLPAGAVGFFGFTGGSSTSIGLFGQLNPGVANLTDANFSATSSIFISFNYVT